MDGNSVPRDFHSEYTGLPFTHCIDCGVEFGQSPVGYSVFKSYVGTEVVFEMAICMNCAKQMRSKYSEETSRNLNQFCETRLRGRISSSEAEGESDSASILEILADVAGVG